MKVEWLNKNVGLTVKEEIGYDILPQKCKTFAEGVFYYYTVMSLPHPAVEPAIFRMLSRDYIHYTTEKDILEQLV